MKPKTVLFAFLSSLALAAYSPAPVNAQEDILNFSCSPPELATFWVFQ